jgi:hypothetical protein
MNATHRNLRSKSRLTRSVTMICLSLSVAACGWDQHTSTVVAGSPSFAKAPTCNGVPIGTSSLQIVPATQLTIGVGATVDYSAINQAGIPVPDCALSWSSSNNKVVTVNSSGVATGKAVGGPIAIRAHTNGRPTLTTSVFLTVGVPVASVTVAPSRVDLAVGDSRTMMLQVLDSKGNILSNRQVVWSSSNTATATITSNGVVTAVSAGSATMTALVEGVRGTATINISSALLAYYKFDGNSLDAGPATRNGQIVGDVAFTTDRLQSVNSAATFNGGYVNIGQLDLTSAFTITAWVKFSSSTGPEGLIVASGNSVDGLAGWNMLLVPCTDQNTETGQTSCPAASTRFLRLHTGSLLSITTSNAITGINTPIVADQWHHIAAVFDGVGTSTLYVNGVTGATRSGMQPPIVANQAAWIGRTPFGGGGGLLAGIDEVRFYSKALSPTEIATVASSTTP